MEKRSFKLVDIPLGKLRIASRNLDILFGLVALKPGEFILFPSKNMAAHRNIHQFFRRHRKSEQSKIKALVKKEGKFTKITRLE